MGWFEAVGQTIKNDYENFVALSNEAYQSDGELDRKSHTKCLFGSKSNTSTVGLACFPYWFRGPYISGPRRTLFDEIVSALR